MKKITLTFFALMAVTAMNPPAGAQVSSRGPDPSTVRDAVLERDSLQNLGVARHYYKMKKAYVAAIARCEEIIAGNPNFSRMDETLYIAGTSSLRLAENRGKQSAKIPPEKLREDARDYLSRLVNEFPDSEFRERAESELRNLGGVKPKSENSTEGAGKKQ